MDPGPTRSPSARSQIKPDEAIGDSNSRVYALVSLALALWALACLYYVLAVVPTEIYWMSYYVADYRFGFVRRGLGGELINAFRGTDYFTAAQAAVWAPTLTWLIALAALVTLILSRGAKHERKLMLTLLLPVLPFSFSYSVSAPRPELFGMTALLIYALCLTRIQQPRRRIVIATLYGVAIAVLALIHEAIPMEFGLGAILATLVLATDATRTVQRICISLAVGPGIVAIALIAWLGRHDAASQLCAQVPHRMIENPYTASTPQKAFDYVFGGAVSRSDYHDWVCNVIKQLDSSFVDGVRSVLQQGALALSASFAVGLLIFAGTIWAIGYFSGVRPPALLGELRGRMLLPAFGVALMIPMFMTGFDWIRWWVMITFDLAIVYLLYALGRPEIEQPPSKTTIKVFVAVVFILAVFPAGPSAHVGGTPFSNTSSDQLGAIEGSAV